MSTSHPFDGADLEQMRSHGIPPDEVQRQLRTFREPPPARGPERPCRVEDGIRRLPEAEHSRLFDRWAAAADAGRLTKLVPASGAATRMFELLRGYLEAGAPNRDALVRQAGAGDAEAAELLRLFAALPRLALYRPLLACLPSDALDDFATVAEALLGEGGLALENRPKALVPFHDYPAGPRTALEEHFVEAAGYLSAGGGAARLHFTTPEGARDEFESAFAGFRESLEDRFGMRFELTTSTQEPSTDTVAVDLENRPFRLEDGRLLFRPAGHGSLLGNLERLGGDIVLIKNIDNVVPEPRQEVTIRWKRLLVGVLTEIEETLKAVDLELASGGSAATARAFEALRFHLAIETPPALSEASAAERRAWLEDRLRRPLRVCGVVPRGAEPGGGPFWVRGEDGGLYGQIVESAQIDPDSPLQHAVWEAATHFNPVDLVCKLRDTAGRPWPLASYVDQSAAFIATKSHGKRPLKALERPGLWNGSMAGWNTAFVEVPAETFHPVKTLLDLLRPGHQA